MHQSLRWSRLKIPLLVEDIVERQQHLLLHGLHHAVFHQHRNIADSFPFGDTLHRHHRPAKDRWPPSFRSPLADLVQCLARLRDERFLFQQIGRPVPTHGQFRKHNQIRAQRLGTLRKLKYLPRISYEVSDRRIDLGKGNLHTTSLQGSVTQPPRPEKLRRPKSFSSLPMRSLLAELANAENRPKAKKRPSCSSAAGPSHLPPSNALQFEQLLRVPKPD